MERPPLNNTEITKIVYDKSLHMEYSILWILPPKSNYPIIKAYKRCCIKITDSDRLDISFTSSFFLNNLKIYFIINNMPLEV